MHRESINQKNYEKKKTQLNLVCYLLNECSSMCHKCPISLSHSVNYKWKDQRNGITSLYQGLICEFCVPFSLITDAFHY